MRLKPNMDTLPTLAISSQPGPNQPVHPLRSRRFWIVELVLVYLNVCFYFGAPAWTMWREGIRITGPIVSVRDPDVSGNEEWVTVRDPASELTYTASMTGHDHDLGTLATVIVHPTDRSKVLTPTTVYIGVVAQCALLVMTIAYPIKATVVHRPRRSMTNSLEH